MRGQRRHPVPIPPSPGVELPAPPPCAPVKTAGEHLTSRKKKSDNQRRLHSRLLLATGDRSMIAASAANHCARPLTKEVG